MEAHQVTMEAQHGAIEAHQVTMEAHLVTVEAQHGAVEPHQVTMVAHHGTVEAHQVMMKAHQVIMEAHKVIMEAHHGALEAHHGAMVSLWCHFFVFFHRFLISDTAMKKNHYHNKLDRFKCRYHGFTPALEVDQTVSSNSCYVTLNGFMLFKSRGMRRNLNEDPAGHP